MFQSGSVLQESARRLNIRHDTQAQQALLTFWHDLFRTGHIGWGYDILNANPPFCHLTEQGRRTLAHLSRDPMNPDGYMAYLNGQVKLSDTPYSYITEALKTYTADCYKAAAVMVGGAAESIALELRDVLVARMKDLKQPQPKQLMDWKIKTVLRGIEQTLEPKKNMMLKPLAEAFESYWPAFVQQIRTVRNDAGHPRSIEPVTQETVYASLLIFPELAKLTHELKDWISTSYS